MHLHVSVQAHLTLFSGQKSFPPLEGLGPQCLPTDPVQSIRMAGSLRPLRCCPRVAHANVCGSAKGNRVHQCAKHRVEAVVLLLLLLLLLLLEGQQGFQRCRGGLAVFSEVCLEHTMRSQKVSTVEANCFCRAQRAFIEGNSSSVSTS